ncbi:tannase/feruloyl esterase family alpha/beta hydrolase [Nocardia sp. NPDC059239]|uniref:tannase/feruloyl esterase family alpha/beta hydrolase n=1 Tax=Nocardia sp. NPDC059239 TaxID=3346785 RepID=UPI0036A9C3F6
MAAMFTKRPKMPGRIVTLATAGLLTAAALSACGTNTSRSSDAHGCTDLSGMAIPASVIGLPTSGGQVTQAKVVPTKGTGEKAMAEYCQVDAALHPVDPKAPDIKMTMALPTHWNGKAFMEGGGGYNGYLVSPEISYTTSLVAGQSLISRGYAWFMSDSGHQANYDDASFTLNDEALHNFAGDALKKTHDAGLFLINARYGKKAERTYFVGKSNGGGEALHVAQSWPNDFAGVVSFAPAWNRAALLQQMGYMTKLFSQPGAWLNPAKQKLLFNAVRDSCDGLDGVHDGLISNPGACHYDPHPLRCPGGADTGDTCLSDAQINAIIAAAEPLKLEHPLASGETGHPAFPFLSGTEMRAPEDFLGTQPPSNPMPKQAGMDMRFWDQYARYFVTKDANFNSLTLDPQNPGQWATRINDLSKIQDVNNPDLSAFAKAGGKALLIHGTADNIISPRSTVDYFNRVQTTMGSAAVHDFARLYLVPGADHYFGTYSPHLQQVSPLFDWATALDNWVEHGQAPQNQVTTDQGSDGSGRTRPLCEYPTWPKYNGTGDVNKADSFTCTN